MILELSNVQGSRNRKVTTNILHERNYEISYETVRRFRITEGLRPFHVIAKPSKTLTIPFLKSEKNVISVNEAIFLHDKAPCMRALATQKLLHDNKINFWGNNAWPGNSPDLNPAEHI